MSQLIEPPTRILPYANLPRVRWTVEQFESLFQMGFLPDRQYELIDGDITCKTTIHSPHAQVITRLFALFSRFFEFPLLLSQFSLWIDEESLPEPDFALLRSSHPLLTARGHVTAADVLLIVEVGDATVEGDLTTKAALYARASIKEYWVIDVAGRRLLLHGEPALDGYQRVTQYDEADIAASLSQPIVTFPVAEVLP